MTAFRLVLAPAVWASLIIATASPVDAKPPQSDEAEGLLPPIESLSAVVERPLFTPGRRKPAGQSVTHNAGPIALSGIVISKRQRYAMIRDEAGGVGRRVTEGQTIGLLVVRRIMPDRLVLAAAGGEEITVRLFDRENANGGAGARPAVQ